MESKEHADAQRAAITKASDQFRKSSFSGPNGDNCVSVADLPNGWRGVRDTKQGGSPVQVYSPAEWDAFVAGVKAGEFD